MGFLENIFCDEISKLDSWRPMDSRGQLKAAEELLERAHELRVCGLEKLATDAPDFGKFCNLLSEVRFANILAQFGSQVCLLGDDWAGNQQGRKGADLHVRFNNGRELLVEVQRGSDGNPRLPEALDRALKESSLPFRVGYILGMETGLTPGLSRPGTRYRERLAQEQLRESVVDSVVKTLRQLPQDASGSMQVESHTFHYEPSGTGEGYVAGGVTGVGFIRSGAHADHFLEHLSFKAVNPTTYVSPWSNMPYVVAYDAEQFGLCSLTVFGALVGVRAFYSADSQEERVRWIEEDLKHLPPAIKDKMADPGWAPLFESWGFHSRGSGFFRGYGCFVNEPWAMNIDGVLVHHPTRNDCQWVPNPWGRSSDPWLLELGPSYAAPSEDEVPF